MWVNQMLPPTDQFNLLRQAETAWLRPFLAVG